MAKINRFLVSYSDNIKEIKFLPESLSRKMFFSGTPISLRAMICLSSFCFLVEVLA